ncbi:MAG: hypothetical protein H6818_05350 [Phycisphaerales bacterium]|nr:hypothetical protein [Phycisphaerales bacterium]MCB9863389.1 hypothetical protein [Phycisphaerales bacterium]
MRDPNSGCEALVFADLRASRIDIQIRGLKAEDRHDFFVGIRNDLSDIQPTRFGKKATLPLVPDDLKDSWKNIHKALGELVEVGVIELSDVMALSPKDLADLLINNNPLVQHLLPKSKTGNLRSTLERIIRGVQKAIRNSASQQSDE